jgi:23S rRNA pseudouridine1911/1915/1917 synthase
MDSPYSTPPPRIVAADLARWILHQDDDIVVVDKPGWVVCHPSKDGPWSSLVGALREYLGAPVLHLVSRLDRETSGVVVVAKHVTAAQRYQMAMQWRRSDKIYLAILTGELRQAQDVDASIARDTVGPVAVKRRIAVAGEPGSEKATTRFEPLAVANGLTLARVAPLTGRTHQIRLHAAHLGHALAGDKLYGADPSLYLDFVTHGWTEKLAAMLPLPRQALHAARLRFHEPGLGDFRAPPPPDLIEFARARMDLDLPALWAKAES